MSIVSELQAAKNLEKWILQLHISIRTNNRADAVVPSKTLNLHNQKMHISKFRNGRVTVFPKELGDSQKFSEVKMAWNKHEWDGIPPGNSKAFAPRRYLK